MKHLHALPAALALSAPCALSQVVVLSGDSLVDAVANAADGETIIIQSDDIFVGTLGWSQKELTIEAGIGYAPTIQGSPDAQALALSVSDPETRATLRGVRLVVGDPDPASTLVPAVSLSGTGTAPVDMVVDFHDCRIEGRFSVGGTGDAAILCDLYGVTLEGELELGGTGDSAATVRVWEGGTLDTVSVRPTGSAVRNLSLVDSEVGGALEVEARSTSQATVTVDRTRLGGSLSVTQEIGASAVVTLDSCLLVGDGGGTGVLVEDGAACDAVNCTVTGFDLALDAALPAFFENMALFGNGQDLDPVVIAQQIENSLIEDGTYDGVFGNFAGTPLVDADYRLVAGSVGIDAGNSAAPGLGSLDLTGEPRIQDSDGDGFAQVNVGAHEALAECAVAAHQAFNGSGANPFFFGVPGEPVLGGTFVGLVTKGPQTVATLVALGTSSAAPITVPLVEGEVLLELLPLPLLHFGNGPHAMPVPDDQALCGAIVDTQGYRLDFDGVLLTVRAGNGQRLVLGE